MCKETLLRKLKQQAASIWRQIRHGLPFQVPTQPRTYLAKSKFSPKHAPRLKRVARQAVEDRLMAAVAHSGIITHTSILNPNYVADSDIPRYAAIPFPKSLSGNGARRLLDQVKEPKDVRSTASFFMSAY